ncbi:MFS transporter [Ktedonosporobacter rubrisoli]|uniref:MFS transporter n=1 Tax=Ktedonosporobacter rubrisoli TaxID=2509675 RepID=A0A4P6JJC3_KTERU|nr:MFS transporter [Ktedonosporobacter rubrisoli]QBD75133.1 MFS transporter [Ktedonosporobacter rubrisoli]
MSPRTQSHLIEVGQEPLTRTNPRIILLTLGMFALGTDAFIVAGILPVIAHETGVSEGLVGQLITVFALTYGLGAPLLAALAGRLSPERVLVGALGLLALANLASALSPSFLFLLLSRILAGCFAAAYTPLAFAVGIKLAPAAKRGQALALVVSGLNIATVLGAPLGTWVGEYFGWRLSFTLVAALAGLAFLALLICGLPKSAPPAPLSLSQRLLPITQPRIVLALLPALLWNTGVYIMYPYVALLLQQQIHISDVSFLLACFGLGIVCANWISGRLADSFRPHWLVLIFLGALLVVQFALPLLTTTLISGAILLLLWGMSFASLFIPQQQRLLNIAPEHANVLLALNNSGLYLGISAGAAVGGLALRYFAVPQLAWIGVLSILSAALIVAITPRLNRKAAQKKKAKA